MYIRTVGSSVIRTDQHLPAYTLKQRPIQSSLSKPSETAPPNQMNQSIHSRLLTCTISILNPISEPTCPSAFTFLQLLRNHSPHLPHTRSSRTNAPSPYPSPSLIRAPPFSRPLPAAQHPPAIGPHTRVRRVAQAPPDRDLVACNMTDAPPAARPCTPGSDRFGSVVGPPGPRHAAVGPGMWLAERFGGVACLRGQSRLQMVGWGLLSKYCVC
ncbi:uncharacterized protein J3D65DRAFT_241721 [Phyllosticta citribraziliensis]|uniref:Uncharacterized protein n=1 Tax=Phyllosticta citribraziliensis TaxID=989973 RepID=A0ABR1LZH9_9PEZI